MATRNSPPGTSGRTASVRRSLLIAVMVSCSLGVPGVAHGATYYLNTSSGSDSNPGTGSAPWQSLAKVQSSAAAGDIIVIQAADAGTYAALWPTHVSYRAAVLKQFEIAWTFDTDYPVGQFANRDLWVVGPVKIVGIDPASTSVSGRVINGSMLNPRAGWLPQGYDSAMPDNTYDAALNVAYNRSAGNPLALAANSSLISSISLPTVGGKTTLQRAAILTVLAAPAHDGDFRPPYCGNDKTPKFNVSMLNRSLLRNLPPVAATPSMAAVEGQFAAPWIDHHAGWVGDQMHPQKNMPDYGREIHTWIGIGGLMLHVNFPPEQKETLLRRYIQVGIDWYGVMVNGGNGNWPNAGGHGGGRKWPILFAGIMLNDAAMKSVGAKSGDYLYQNGYGPGRVPPDYVHFGEDDQTFCVAQIDVDATHSPDWRPDSRDAERIPYETSDIGLPEWGIEHSTDPYQSNKWLPTEYRGVAGPPFHGTALAALLIPGAKALWNHNAYFDYTDRYVAFTSPGGEYAGWWHTMSDFTDQMWDTYRAQFGPVWPAVATVPVLTPIGNQQVTTGQTLTLTLSATGGSGTLTYSASGLALGATFSGNTFTWTPGATQAGDYQVMFTVSDGQAQDSETITITVTQANSAPVLAAIGNQSVNENQLLTFTISATDADNNPLTYSASGLPSGASLTGSTFSWTPTYSQAGSYDVTFTASDGQKQSSQTITITVMNVDRAPVLADVGSRSVNVTKSLNFTLPATDPDGDNLTFWATGLPSGATLTGPTFAWAPTSNQVGSYPVTFTVSDGTLTDSKTATITVAMIGDDRAMPVVTQCSPAPDAIQVSLNNLVTLHITDANTGVDANTVAISVNGNLVYHGSTDAYTSAFGRCSRTGAKDDYRFIYQANAAFDFDQTIAVRVNAADLAGNVMSEYSYSFTTQMRAFGRNLPVSTLGGSAGSRPATARDAAGNIWVAWHAGAAGSRDIYVAKLPVDATAFQTPIQLTSDAHDQCNPALAVSATGAVYVVWQDNRNGNWDLYASICSNGSNFAKEVQVTSSNRNEINPALALDHQSPAAAYVAWQDDRNGNQDIYVAKSTDGFASSTIARVTSNAADQVEPKVAVDSSNVAYVVWTDLRNGQADIYAAASSGSGGAWSEVALVAGPGQETQPAIAAGLGTTLHLLWVDNSSGNNDIYYAALNGLPSSPVTGVNIVDDTSGADQTAPAIACGTAAPGGLPRVFACWTDARHAGANGADTDLYVAEWRAGAAGTNVLVGDGGTRAGQSEPALGVDRYGQPYVVWTDARQTTTEIYYAATTSLDPTPLDTRVVVAGVGAVVGTDPAAIKTVQDISLVVPAGAGPTDLSVTISRVLNPQVSPAAILGSYDFSPSGITFNQAVTVTIPYAVTPTTRRVLPYWYDAATGALSQQGITDVQNLLIAPKVNALQFRTTHFTPYYLVDVGIETVGGSPGGGCAVSSSGDGSLGELLLPYAAIAVIYLILHRRDRRNRLLRLH